MNLIIFCAILCFPTTLAFQVSFHKVNRSIFEYEAGPSLVCTPHQFRYQRGDNFTIYMKVLNGTPAVGYVFLETRSDTKHCTTWFTPGATIKLQTEQIAIHVELVTKDGCLRETILEGREMPANATNKENIYNDICIKENKCMAIVNVDKECRHMKPQPCEEKSYRTPRSSTAAPLNKHDENLNATYKMLKILSTIVFPAVNTLNSPENPTRNISITSSSTGAETYFTVMIITSITAAVALILLLVIAYRWFCWKTGSGSGLLDSLGVPENPANANRYYENVVFGGGSKQNDEQLKQRASEDPQPSEHHYEEINNY